MQKITDDDGYDCGYENQGRNTEDLGRCQSQVTGRHIGGIDLEGSMGRDNKNQGPVDVEVPSVATIAGTRPNETISPLTIPRTSPRAQPSRMPSSRLLWGSCLKK